MKFNKKIKNWVLPLTILLMIINLLPVASAWAGEEPEPVYTIQYNNAQVKISGKDTLYVLKDGYERQTVAQWSAEPADHVVLDTKTGKVQYAKFGKVTITATLEDDSNVSVEIPVRDIKISLFVPGKKINAGTKFYVMAQAKNIQNTPPFVKLSVNKTSIASVSSKGRVIAKKPGKLKVYLDYGGEKKTAVSVTILKKVTAKKGKYKKGSVYGPYLSNKKLKQVKAKAKKIVKKVTTKKMTDAQKVSKLHSYLVKHCKYAARYDKNEANSAWGALIKGEAQCSGYARGFKALCDAANVKCFYVHANKKSINPVHQWNIVRVDSNWYHIDVQANDSSGFRAIYLASDDFLHSFGLSWSRKGLPKCPEYWKPKKLIN